MDRTRHAVQLLPGRWGRVEHTRLNAKGEPARTTVWLLNSKYSAEVEVRPTGAVLKAVNLKPGEGVGDLTAAMLAVVQRGVAFEVGALRDIGLPQLFDRPTFRVTGLDDRPDHVGLSFEWEQEIGGKPSSRLAGTFRLDPANDFAVVGLDATDTSPLSGRVSVETTEYKYQLAEGLQRPSTITGRIVNRDGKGGPPSEFRSEMRFEYDRPTLTEQDCTLSAFDLPEPVGVEWSRPMPTYIWLLVAAGGAAVLSFGFGWLRRRATRPHAPPAGPTP